MLKKIYLLVATFLSATVLYAQVTTSSMTGTVKDMNNSPLQGATITAIHTPTGTKYVGTTNQSGRINLANMRVGGPYKVEITYAGLSPEVQDDIFLELGQPYILNTTLQSGKVMDEVLVIGRSNALMRRDRIGTATTIGRTQIEELPSISRSVNDLTRLTPQANGTAIGGGNYRSNNFTVDGANFNNQFGIGQNVPANGSPISLDALEQISVNLTPYDVRQTGFTGASINAVTRSGKNEFFGTAFLTYRDDKMQGYRIGDVFAPAQSLKINQYGISVGGPIIKNKLFFFFNLEQQKITQPGPSKIAATAGAPFGSASYVARPRASFLDSVSQYLMDNYGYATGPYQGYSNKSNNDKLFGRIDWNINANHRINIRYSQVESKDPRTVSSSTTNSGVSFSNANNRLSSNALHFFNSNYFQEDNLYSGTLEYNGKLGDYNHSFRASRIHQNAPRSSPGSLFPLVDILDGSSVLTTFGYEPFTYGNLRDVKTTTLNYDGNYVLGAHNLTAGVQYETSLTKNGFQRFGTGYYVFNSWSDFVNNAKPSNYALTYPLTADGSQAFPSFKFSQFSLYLQDDYTINNKLKLMGGIRFELPTYPGVTEIQTHPLVAALKFAPMSSGGDSTIINTGTLPKTQLMISPRFGFNYDIKGDRTIVLRGGTGVFTGRIPFVWIVAQSGDAGMLQYLMSQSGQANTPYFDADVKANYPTTLPTAGTSIPGSISAMSPNLKFPSTWKSSIGADFRLPWGLIATVEGIYNKDINAVVAKNMNLVDPTAMSISGYADNRAIYPATGSSSTRYLNYINRLATVSGNDVPSATGTRYFDAIVMENDKGGHYWSLTAQLTKVLEKGFSGMIAYTLSGGKNYGDGSGDQIANLWSLPYSYSGNPNSPTLSFTDNILPHRLVGSVSYSNNWIAKLKTSMTVFYSGSSMGRYSYYYTSDFNRDYQTNDLIYVPKDASEITFVPIAAGTSGYAKAYTAIEQSDIFFKLIDSDPYLKTRKGQYAERNGAIMPWRNQFDFHLSQELFNGIGGLKNSMEVFWDVFNIGNLFNSKWGVYEIANNGILTPMNMSSVTATGTTVPTFRLAAANGDIISSRFRDNQTTTSTYYMQVGVRLKFN
ncbi:MAG: carboxypeptidase regulatory-like domain-containing protein [Niabella sp.]